MLGFLVVTNGGVVVFCVVIMKARTMCLVHDCVVAGVSRGESGRFLCRGGAGEAIAGYGNFDDDGGCAAVRFHGIF